MEIGRREFLKAAALGTASMAAAGVLGSHVFAEESEEEKEFAGKKKFAGVGCTRAVADDI